MLTVIDTAGFQFRGHVRQTRLSDLARVFDGSNLVVDAAYEAIIESLVGTERIAFIEFGNTGGQPATKGLRSLRSPVGSVAVGSSPETKAFTTKDDYGVRSIGTWSAVYTPTLNVTYDMLGLVTTSGILFAAVAFDAVTLTAGESLLVQWTIQLRS